MCSLAHGRTPDRERGRAGSLNPNFHPVVDRLDEVLFGSQVPFRGLNRSVPEQQLYLLQFPSRLAAQLGAGPPQIMRCQIGVADGGARPPY